MACQPSGHVAEVGRGLEDAQRRPGATGNELTGWTAARGLGLSLKWAMSGRVGGSIVRWSEAAAERGETKVMKKWIIRLAVLATVVVAGAAGYQPAVRYWNQRNQPQWRTADVLRGDVIAVVNSTGTIKPVLSVQVGSFVSGPIEEVVGNFNQEVKAGETLARIDPRIYEAERKRATAALANARADVRRIEALLKQASNDEARALNLRAEDQRFISDTEMDQYRFNKQSLEAQREVALASVSQAEAMLENATANVGYTTITAPVDGIIIDRKIDPGQTLAAQFQTPELFVVAPQMREKMHVYASVDEADIGLIRAAKETGQPVHFTVDAYPEDLFQGSIEEIRFSSTELQNVVTYPVIVAAPNPDLKLLPGMTASISFRVAERKDVIKIPNAALRFYPQKQYVRAEDLAILEGTNWEQETANESTETTTLSAEEKTLARRRRNRRHVWVQDQGKLKAIEVVTGLSDSKFTELVSGELPAGASVITGLETKRPGT